MKLPTCIFCFGIAMAANVHAQSLIDVHCGADHKNELATNQVVIENPDGYYLPDMQIQLSNGDPRIIRAVGSEFHLCTREAATPEMNITLLFSLPRKREVTYLFVPNSDCPDDPTS